MDVRKPGTMHRRMGAERGAVLVEFSLVVVLFVALLYGLIAFGMALALKQSMTNAASEGARTAVGADPTLPPGDPDSREGVARGTILERLSWLGDKRADALEPNVDIAQSGCDENPFTGAQGQGNASETCLWVELEYDYKGYPLVPALALPGFGYLFPETITSNSAVQMPPASP